MIFEGNDFNTIYTELVKYILENGNDVVVRGESTKECTLCILTLKDVEKDYVDFTNTKAFKRQSKYEKYRSEEIKWYESGCLIAEHAPAKFWNGIADTDGMIQLNYGYIVIHEKKPYMKSGATSYENALKLLINDKFSRQVILHYNLPIHYANNAKDIPCTVCTQILIREDKLIFLVYQRSSDLYRGLIYDIPWHCYLIKKMRDDLRRMGINVNLGEINMILGSVHIYNNDIEFFKKFLEKR